MSTSGILAAKQKLSAKETRELRELLMEASDVTKASKTLNQGHFVTNLSQKGFTI